MKAAHNQVQQLSWYRFFNIGVSELLPKMSARPVFRVRASTENGVYSAGIEAVTAATPTP